MRTKILIPLLVSLLLLVFSGCQSPWQPGGQTYTSHTGAFTALVPAGWMFAELPPGHVLATKDGIILQRIEIRTLELKDPLPGSKRVLRADMTPFEIAEAVVDDLKADHGLLGLEVVENQPTEVAGRPGFRITITFHTEDNLRLTQSGYGVVDGPKLYVISYIAPTRYYFDRDRETFEAAVKSFHLGAK
jgi:hypothetical protein